MGRRVNKVLIGILVLGILLRLQGITNPLLDDQGWRQADTASMALNMLGHLGNFPDVLFPMLNYDGPGPQKVELEFPVLPYLLAATWSILGWSDLWGRLWAVFFAALTIGGVYEAGRLMFSQRAGLWAAAFYAVLPLTVYYGRVVMPEPVAQAFSIWAICLILRWCKAPTKQGFLGACFLMAMAILGKLPQLMIFPVALLTGFWPIREKWLKMFAYSLLALILPMLYYLWVHWGAGAATQFVSGILSGQVMEGPQLFWIQLKKNLREGLSFPMLILAGAGLVLLVRQAFLTKALALRTPGRNGGIALALILWSLISIVYLGWICLRIPLDYYLVPVALPLVLCAGYALDSLEDIPGFVLGVLFASILLLNYAFTYSEKYTWNEEYLTQAVWVREHTPAESVLVLSDVPPMTLYYSQRYGFRLANPDDRVTWAELQAISGDYLVALPGSRGEEFWQNVNNTYPQVGPGVYRLDRQGK